MPEFNNVVHAFETLNMDFSKLTLAKVYVVQEEAVTQVLLKENMVSYQVTKHKINVTVHKTLLREKEQEIVAQEKVQISLAEAIKSAIAEFLLEAGQEDEDSATKVSRLSWIAVELKKHVEDLQAKKASSTPLEVLEE